MTPSIAALLGRWFWWPLKVRPRPASAMLRPYGTRPSVHELLGGSTYRNPDVDTVNTTGKVHGVNISSPLEPNREPRTE